MRKLNGHRPRPARKREVNRVIVGIQTTVGVGNDMRRQKGSRSAVLFVTGWLFGPLLVGNGWLHASSETLIDLRRGWIILL
jgi:hypothetical protein